MGEGRGEGACVLIIGTLLKTSCSGQMPLEKLAMHHFKLDKFEKAYDVFKDAADENAMKVMIAVD